MDFTNINTISTAKVEMKSDIKETKLESSQNLDEQQDKVYDSMAPASFIFLLAQMLPQPADDKSLSLTLDKEAPPHSIVNNQSTNQPIKMTDTDAAGTPSSTIPENNIALAWINFNGYQASQMPNQEDQNTAQEGEIETNASIAQGKKYKTDAINDEETGVSGANEDLIQSPKILSGSSTGNLEEHRFETNQSQAEKQLLDNLQNIPQLGIHTQQANKNSLLTSNIKTTEIPVPVTNPDWADKFSEHIMWLGNQNIKSALIKIHPEDLGPIEISIKVIKDSASITINTHNNHIRDVVDQALPRLREMMSEQGLNLTEAHVGTDTNSQRFFQEQRADYQAFLEGEGDNDVQITPLNKKPPKGIIDFFA